MSILGQLSSGIITVQLMKAEDWHCKGQLQRYGVLFVQQEYRKRDTRS